MRKTQRQLAAPNRKPDGIVARIWRLYDDIAGGAVVPRGLAVDLAISQGFKPGTSSTQFQRWRAARQ